MEFIHFALFDNSSCLERETAHSLSITCASTPFQNDVEGKRIRERTGHISNALFKYEKPNKEQSKCVSECLEPPSMMKGGDNLKSLIPR